MIPWLKRCRARFLAKKQAQRDENERLRILQEEQLKRCNAGQHEWEVTHEVQGDGDPNVEGYILVTRTTCRVCHLSETTIEPYKSDSDDAQD